MTQASEGIETGADVSAATGRTDALPGPGGRAHWGLAAAVVAVVGINLAWGVLRDPPRVPAAGLERLLPVGDYPALRPWHEEQPSRGPLAPETGASR
jgi:hypothetical protein